MDPGIDELIDRGAPGEAEARIEGVLAAGGADGRVVEAAVRLHLRRGDVPRARERLVELVKRFPRLAQDPRTLLAEAAVATAEGRAAESREAWSRALDAARDGGHLEEEVAALAGLSLAAHVVGESGRALHLAEEALELARRRELSALEASLLADLARLHRADGRLGAAIDCADSAREAFDALGDRPGWIRATVALADLFASACDRRALPLAAEALAEARRLGHARLSILAALVPARLALEEGELPRTREALAAAGAIAEAAGSAPAELALVRGRAAVLAGDRAEVAAAAPALPPAAAPRHPRGAAWFRAVGEGVAPTLEALGDAAAEAERLGEREAGFRLHAALAAEHLRRAGRSGSVEAGFAAYHHLARARALLEEVASGLPEAQARLYLSAPERARVLAEARRAEALAGVARAEPERRDEGDRRLALRVMSLDRRRVAGDLDPKEVRAAVLEGVLELTGAARVFLRLPGARGPVPGRSLVGAELEVLPDESHPHLAAVLAGRPFVAHDLSTPGAGPGEIFSRGAVVCVPVQGAEGRPGWLYADHPNRPGLFAPTDVDVLRAFADQGAVAVEHAELLARARADAARLAAQQQEIERLSRQLVDKLERREAALSDALRRLEEIDPASPAPRARLVGSSEPMRRLLRTLDRIRLTDASVVISGESGTGKELVARIVHEESDRSAGPFVSINCAAIPEELLESELFGHEKGAFTGAGRARPGLFVAADGGTLFLDEIGDTPLSMQAKLLRVLQDGEVRPVGAEQSRRVNVRVVAATHRDLERLVDEGRFRADLYYRLNVIRLQVPPLRERTEDLPLLVAHLLQRSARGGGPPPMIEPEALELLASYGWPGNVRELDAAVRTALIFTEEGVLTASAFLRKPELARLARGRGEGPPLRPSAAAPLPPAPDAPEPPPHLRLEELERWAIVRALESCGGNKAAAARALGLGRVTLYRKLRAYGLASPDELPRGPKRARRG